MRRPSPLVSRGSETDIDSAMTPMIDVVFLLLVFFVWTASFQIVEHVMPSELSEQIGSDRLGRTASAKRFRRCRRDNWLER